MAEENLNLPNDQSIEYHIVTLFEKIEGLRNEAANTIPTKLPVQVEIRTLEFWRSVISECLASFIYVFIVWGASASASAGVGASVVLSAALASGFTMTALTQCFSHISGAQINPAVTLAMGVTKRNTVLRTGMFIAAQCGGGIAGAAFLYGTTTLKNQRNANEDLQSYLGPAWETFSVEFILTFIVVLVYLVCMDTHRKWLTTSSLTVGATYSACSFVNLPRLNPARSLGPSFVLNRWQNHWVYWVSPMVAGLVSGLTYEFVFNPNRHKRPKDLTDGESSSVRSDDDAYDDLDKPVGSKFNSTTYNAYRGNTTGYCTSLTTASLYSAPPTRLERVESIYGGTKSLYCKSPPLTRANLNRSQSVYTKSNSGVHRDVVPKPGPLVPAQSLYPMRLNQPTHVQNQNVQNQLHQRSESIYGLRGANRTDSYGRTGDGKYDDGQKTPAGRRPESLYGVSRRGQSVQSDDSSYGSYQGSRGTTGGYHGQKNVTGGVYGNRSSENRQSPSTQLLSTVTNATYHHNLPQESPNSQY